MFGTFESVKDSGAGALDHLGAWIVRNPGPGIKTMVKRGKQTHRNMGNHKVLRRKQHVFAHCLPPFKIGA